MFDMLDAITIGSATRDVFLKGEGFEIRKHGDSPTGVEQCFPLGSKIEIKDAVFTTGGGGTNAAVTFSRQGLKTGWVGVIGNDFNGKELINELKREKVKLFFSKHKDDLTAYSVILVHPNAERTILSYKGEGQHFNAEEINWKKLKAKWFFLDSLGGNWDLLQRAFEYITARNFRIAFNPGGKELAHGLEKLKPHLAAADIFSVNKEEGEVLLNSKFKTAEEVLKELDKLVKGIVVLTLGPEGVLVSAPLSGVSDKKNIYKAGTPDSPRVERTGAGDAFNSGFVSQMIKENQPEAGGWNLEAVKKSIQFATANASSVVAQYGPKAGILKKDDWGPWPLVNVQIS
ncbi:MAG: carbohydrate kinase family protein [Parcubacteria group bacterium]|nr:carbohydrate kinase family protein [Parcubacteria group bacterium]